MTSADTARNRASRSGHDEAARPRTDEPRHDGRDDGHRPAAARDGDVDRAQPRRTRRPMRELLASALSEFNGLVGRPIEGVSAVERTDDGWRVDVDVVELERIPDTTSLLATYELELDENGDVVSYRRTRRYHRASTEDS